MVKRDGGSIMHGVVSLKLGSEGLMEKSILAQNLQNNYTFQHNNNPNTNQSLTKEMMMISVLEWPEQSSDLNPIENLRSYLKTAVNRRSLHNLIAAEEFQGRMESQLVDS